MFESRRKLAINVWKNGQNVKVASYCFALRNLSFGAEREQNVRQGGALRDQVVGDVWGGVVRKW